MTTLDYTFFAIVLAKAYKIVLAYISFIGLSKCFSLILNLSESTSTMVLKLTLSLFTKWILYTIFGLHCMEWPRIHLFAWNTKQYNQS